jgi:beta-glucosidase/6-phospho-beta-glucosidase/beta-galactosidase
MFRSFFFAGFECATGYNAVGDWIDQIAATHHDQHADADYRRLEGVRIYAAREAIRWPVVDQNGRYDFTTVEPFVRAAEKYNIDVIWDLFHYGYPEGLDLFSDEFPRRFADYCHAAAEYICRNHHGPRYFTPVNEPSFFAWAAGAVGRFAPHCTDRGFALKVQLARAGIAGINAIRSAVRESRIVNVDPLCHMTAPDDRPDLMEQVAHFNNVAVYESWDMLAGRLLPELGGSRAHLDVPGINYYGVNQWDITRTVDEPLALHDPRRLPLRELVTAVWERYGGDLLITETAHNDDLRPWWLNYVAAEAKALLHVGVPLRGVCLYPILGMPEWHEPEKWALMGLWDCLPDGDKLARQLCVPMYEALQRAQSIQC